MDKDLTRLQHMLDSTNAILTFVKGKKRQDLDNDRLLFSGIIRELEILGEAAGKISKESRERFPNLPWHQLIGMRNRLIHVYFDINHDIIWQTIQNSIEPLKIQLENIVSNLKH